MLCKTVCCNVFFLLFLFNYCYVYTNSLFHVPFGIFLSFSLTYCVLTDLEILCMEILQKQVETQLYVLVFYTGCEFYFLVIIAQYGLTLNICLIQGSIGYSGLVYFSLLRKIFWSCNTNFVFGTGPVSFIIMVQNMAWLSCEYNQDTSGALNFTPHHGSYGSLKSACIENIWLILLPISFCIQI